jgi:hypothetical protein
MGALLNLAELWLPGFIQRRELVRLLNSTAGAFQVEPPAVMGMPFEACLSQYARFTRDQAEKRLGDRDVRDVQTRLYASALEIGRRYRERFALTPGEVMRLARVIYRGLRIDFHGQPDGQVIIGRCFFSQYYSDGVCKLVSSLDAGLLAGLSGGGTFTFSERITEGRPFCKAFLQMGRGK